jgi:hypothetical protein
MGFHNARNPASHALFRWTRKEEERESAHLAFSLLASSSGFNRAAIPTKS